LRLDRFWLMRLCRTSDANTLELPEDLPICRVNRVVVFDEHRFPVGTLLNCQARHKVMLSNDVWHRVTEFRRRLNELTPREISILNLVYEGMTNKEASEAVEISAKTIEKHRAKIMRKLHVQGVVELVRRMSEAHLAFPDEPMIKGRSDFG
jgi:DNA-binding CsgD family transcriptional regulator